MGQAMSARTTTSGQLQSQDSDAHQAATAEDHQRASSTQMPGSSAADGKAPSWQPAPAFQLTEGDTEREKAPSGKHEIGEGAVEGHVEQADAAEAIPTSGQVVLSSAPEKTQAEEKAHAVEVGHSGLPQSAAELGHVKADLQELVDAGGGSLASGWAVQVTYRPSGMHTDSRGQYAHVPSIGVQESRDSTGMTSRKLVQHGPYLDQQPPDCMYKS